MWRVFVQASSYPRAAVHCHVNNCWQAIVRKSVTAVLVHYVCLCRTSSVLYKKLSDLKRFAHDSLHTKLSTKVKCPVRNLDLERFAAEKSECRPGSLYQ